MFVIRVKPSWKLQLTLPFVGNFHRTCKCVCVSYKKKPEPACSKVIPHKVGVKVWDNVTWVDSLSMADSLVIWSQWPSLIVDLLLIAGVLWCPRPLPQSPQGTVQLRLSATAGRVHSDQHTLSQRLLHCAPAREGGDHGQVPPGDPHLRHGDTLPNVQPFSKECRNSSKGHGQ